MPTSTSFLTSSNEQRLISTKRPTDNLPKLVYTKFRYNKEKEIMQPTNEIIEII